jgi:hypothetical protein
VKTLVGLMVDMRGLQAACPRKVPYLTLIAGASTIWRGSRRRVSVMKDPSKLYN